VYRGIKHAPATCPEQQRSSPHCLRWSLLASVFPEKHSVAFSIYESEYRPSIFRTAPDHGTAQHPAAVLTEKSKIQHARPRPALAVSVAFSERWVRRTRLQPGLHDNDLSCLPMRRISRLPQARVTASPLDSAASTDPQQQIETLEIRSRVSYQIPQESKLHNPHAHLQFPRTGWSLCRACSGPAS